MKAVKKSDELEVQIFNCNNIDSGVVCIKKNHLNIKYAINGTGKSTISSSIEGLLNEDYESLIPFKYYPNKKNLSDEQKPRVEIYSQANQDVLFSIENSPIKSIKVFNEKYVEKFTFIGDDVVPKSFEIYVKTPEYEEKIQEINSLIQEIRDYFKINKDLDDIISRFEQFLTKIVKPGKQKAYSTTSPLYKALSSGNLTINVPDELLGYESFITRPDSGQWAGWKETGNSYFDWENDKAHCPYCAKSIEPTYKPVIKQLSDKFNSAYLKDLKIVLEAFEGVKDFFVDSVREKIDRLGATTSGFTKNEDELIRMVCERVDALLSRLQSAKKLGYETLSAESNIVDLLRNNQIQLDIYSELNSEKTISIVDKLNQALEHAMSRVIELKAAIEEQNIIIRETIRKNELGINQFLSKAGYQYTVSIIEDEKSKEYKMILKYQNGNIAIPSIKSHLSYGERNAFALALFMYDVIKELPDLIILDDPISSFDKYKKFAIMDMLFCNDDVTLRGKTVLMLTHDFEPISDVLKTHATAFTWKSGELKPGKQFVHASYLRNVIDPVTAISTIEERRLLDSDVKNYINILRKNSKNAGNLISKLIYLRRLKELEMEKNEVWDVLSCFFHKDVNKPVRFNRDINDYETIEEDTVILAETEITESINEVFNYQIEYQRFWKPDKLIEEYNKCCNGYEKLQIYRCISEHFCSIGNEEEDNIFAKFINETYHSEMDYIFQLDPREFEVVPNYILNRCNDKVAQIQCSYC